MPLAEARKLLEEAVAYARGLGRPPHADYEKAVVLFGNANAADSDAQFTFGKDGKPFYCQGPYESLAEAAAITQRVVDAGGSFIVGGPGANLQSLPGIDSLEVDDFNDDDDDDNDENHNQISF